MILLNPKKYAGRCSDDRSREIVTRTIDFFESKGLSRVKKDDRDRVWYQDLLDFITQEEIFATLLTPAEYGTGDCRWDNWRNNEFNEILAFDFMVRDFSSYALQLYHKPSATPEQMELCLKMIRKPVVDQQRFQRVWEGEVYALAGEYEMND